MRTNAVVTIYQKTRDWTGDASYDTGTQYEVWLEQSTSVKQTRVYNKQNYAESFVGAGIFFLFNDISLDDAEVLISGKRYNKFVVDRFLDRKGNFHHLEVTYA